MVLFLVVVIRLEMPRHEADARRCSGLLGPRDHGLLKKHVHEHDEGLWFHHQRARRLVGARVEVLVHAVHVHDRNIARLPVVAHAVVHLVPYAVQDVESRLVDVAVLLRAATGGIDRRRLSSSLRLYWPSIARTKTRSFLLE